VSIDTHESQPSSPVVPSDDVFAHEPASAAAPAPDRPAAISSADDATMFSGFSGQGKAPVSRSDFCLMILPDDFVESKVVPENMDFAYVNASGAITLSCARTAKLNFSRENALATPSGDSFVDFCSRRIQRISDSLKEQYSLSQFDPGMHDGMRTVTLLIEGRNLVGDKICLAIGFAEGSMDYYMLLAQANMDDSQECSDFLVTVVSGLRE